MSTSGNVMPSELWCYQDALGWDQAEETDGRPAKALRRFATSAFRLCSQLNSGAVAFRGRESLAQLATGRDSWSTYLDPGTCELRAGREVLSLRDARDRVLDVMRLDGEWFVSCETVRSAREIVETVDEAVAALLGSPIGAMGGWVVRSGRQRVQPLDPTGIDEYLDEEEEGQPFDDVVYDLDVDVPEDEELADDDELEEDDFGDDYDDGEARRGTADHDVAHLNHVLEETGYSVAQLIDLARTENRRLSGLVAERDREVAWLRQAFSSETELRVHQGEHLQSRAEITLAVARRAVTLALELEHTTEVQRQRIVDLESAAEAAEADAEAAAQVGFGARWELDRAHADVATLGRLVSELELALRDAKHEVAHAVARADAAEAARSEAERSLHEIRLESERVRLFLLSQMTKRQRRRAGIVDLVVQNDDG